MNKKGISVIINVADLSCIIFGFILTFFSNCHVSRFFGTENLYYSILYAFFGGLIFMHSFLLYLTVFGKSLPRQRLSDERITGEDLTIILAIISFAALLPYILVFSCFTILHIIIFVLMLLSGNNPIIGVKIMFKKGYTLGEV